MSFFTPNWQPAVLIRHDTPIQLPQNSDVRTSDANSNFSTWLLSAAGEPDNHLRLITYPISHVAPEFEVNREQNAANFLKVTTSLPHSPSRNSVLWVDLPLDGSAWGWTVTGECGNARVRAYREGKNIVITSLWQVDQQQGSRTWTYDYRQATRFSDPQYLREERQRRHEQERGVFERWLRIHDPKEAATPAFWKGLLAPMPSMPLPDLSRQRFLELAREYGYTRQLADAGYPDEH